MEYLYTLQFVGDKSTGPDRVLARLLRNIADGGNGTPNLRIGGGTADSSWWNPLGAPKPDGITFDITPAFVLAVSSFRALTHQPLVLDLNFAANRPSYAVDWARAAVNGFGRSAITAFDIGNEPDYYQSRQFGAQKARPPGWGFGDYLRQVSRFSRRLKELRSWLPLAAPNACCEPGWDHGLTELLQRDGRRLSLVTYHHVVSCGPSQMPMQELLSEKTIQAGVGRLGALSKVARQYHKRLRITETDPNGCSGDIRYGTALWAIDWLYALAALNIEGADFHQTGSAPFDIVYVDGVPSGHFEGRVSPIYYAMLLFARGAGKGARLLPLATFTEHASRGGNARLWATIDRKGTVRVTAVNKDASAGIVSVRILGAQRGGSLQRLRGPDPSASQGVSLAGQVVGDPTTSGNLEGSKVLQHIDRGAHSTYRFRLPGNTAALLTVGHVGMN